MRLAIAFALAFAVATSAASRHAGPREVRVPVGKFQLYAREIGQGRPILVLHGGPDFDSRYFLPDMDQFADAYRLIYYDQRGRGRSAVNVQPEDVTLDSEMTDLDAVREYFALGRTTLLGHSWGSVIALEYAIRHPDKVSRLILMNPAPASALDWKRLRDARVAALGDDLQRMRAIAATDAYKEGDPDAVTAYYRIHFTQAVRKPADLDRLMARMHASFSREGVVKARQVEDRLNAETTLVAGYDLLPKLRSLSIPTLVIYADHDFIPFETVSPMARALPNATLVTLKECGHFSFMECPGAVRTSLKDFFRSWQQP